MKMTMLNWLPMAFLLAFVYDGGQDGPAITTTKLNYITLGLIIIKISKSGCQSCPGREKERIQVAARHELMT